MKKLSIGFLTLALSLSAAAQDKKAEAGAVGVGFGINVVSNVQPLVQISYMVNNNIEIGTNLTVQFSRNRASDFDSTVVFSGPPTPVSLPAERETRMVTSSTAFGFNPFFRYHFNTKNNLDVYTGVVVPFSVSTPVKTVNSTITKADDYESVSTIRVTNPVEIGIGAGVLLGCRWFFYENLALGAETNLGVLATIANGNQKTVTSLTNSGSNNPGPNPDDLTVEDKVKVDSQNFSFLRSIGFSLSWYFGGKKASN